MEVIMKTFSQLRIASLALLAALCLTLAVSSASAQILYDNGPVNGETDAWTINYHYVVTDSFTLTAPTNNVQQLQFWAWLTPGDTAMSVEALITTQTLGGNTLFDQVLNLTQSNCFVNHTSPSFDVCLETTSLSVQLGRGTDWLQLKNALATNGDPMYWDENSGLGCGGNDGQGGGCRSLAYENFVGTIPSEAFTLDGPSGTLPEPSGVMVMLGAGFFVLAGGLIRRAKVRGWGT
jgi:hypothetical protein